MSAHLCLGIDPAGETLEEFRSSVDLHARALRALEMQTLPPLKLQLAYFLKHGSHGVSLLEGFCAAFRGRSCHLLLDAKFNDIASTLDAYLHFAFQHLGAHGITLNPLLGEASIAAATAAARKHAGAAGRVFVLCATSEFPMGPLRDLSSAWPAILEAVRAADAALVGAEFGEQEATTPAHVMMSAQASPRARAGVVVGANRSEILFQAASGDGPLTILAPGLGAQGADWNTVQQARSLSSEVWFPMSRALFAGGRGNLETTLAAVRTALARMDDPIPPSLRIQGERP